MIVNPIYLLYGAVFIGVLFMVEGLYLLISDAASRVSEPVVANDYKGVGAFILASLELDR